MANYLDLKAILLNVFDACKDERYVAAQNQSKTWEYNPKRVADIVEHAKLNWSMSDDGLKQIIARVDGLLTTCLGIFGLVVSAMQIGKVTPGLLVYISIGLLVAAIYLLLIGRWKLTRHVPTEMNLISRDSHTIKDDDDWQFQMAANYYLANIANDVTAGVYIHRNFIVIVCVVLSLLFLAISICLG